MNNVNFIRNMDERNRRSVVIEWLKEKKYGIIPRIRLKSTGRCIT